LNWYIQVGELYHTMEKPNDQLQYLVCHGGYLFSGHVNVAWLASVEPMAQNPWLFCRQVFWFTGRMQVFFLQDMPVSVHTRGYLLVRSSNTKNYILDKTSLQTEVKITSICERLALSIPNIQILLYTKYKSRSPRVYPATH
jgi:hypothetical protein